LAGTVIYSRDSFLEPGHVVQEGENLQDLAQQYQVPVEFLARINGIEPPHQLFPGETIKVVQGPFRAEVNCTERQITLFLGRYYAGRFPARIGPELPPEANTYEVASIEPGLEYFDTRSGNRIAQDDPENPYGTVWISLRGNQITTAHRVGIHVDNGDPQRGCVGVSETDARDLAAILGPGSAIQVIP
jgi:LysM repeat protein